MRRREGVSPPDPEIERQLGIVDSVLAGEPVSGGGSDDSWAEVAMLLRAERPDVDPEWAAGLDEWAAAGFPRDSRPGGRRRAATPRSLGERVAEQARRFSARRLVAPAGALASLLVVVAVALGTLSDNRGDNGGTSGSPETADSAALTAPEAGSEQALAPSQSDEMQRQIEPAGPATVPPRGGGAWSQDPARKSFAPGVSNRRVDRDAQMTIAARPEEVRETSDEVIAIGRSLGGIVAAAQVSETGEQAAANIDLRLPSRNLDSAIDRLTAIGDVDSLQESAIDITRPFVSAEDRLADAEAERAKLLEALGNATTDEEAESIRWQLRDARREIARAEARFENVARKARWSELAVTVRSDPSVEKERSLSDWLEDAAAVLESLAGVLLISAAIILPVAILIAALWLLLARLRRRRRERALDA